MSLCLSTWMGGREREWDRGKRENPKSWQYYSTSQKKTVLRWGCWYIKINTYICMYVYVRVHVCACTADTFMLTRVEMFAGFAAEGSVGSVITWNSWAAVDVWNVMHHCLTNWFLGFITIISCCCWLLLNSNTLVNAENSEIGKQQCMYLVALKEFKFKLLIIEKKRC